MMTAVMAIALVLFPTRSRGAPDNDASVPTKPAGRGGGKRTGPVTKSADAGTTDIAPVVADAPALPGSATGRSQEKGKSGEDVPEKSLPTGKGLPVQVSTAIYFLDLKSFDDNKSEFEATVDLRLQWVDLRQRFALTEAVRGYKEYRGKQAEEQLEKVWSPDVDATNRIDAPSFTARRLRIYADGSMETITRTTARYKVHVESERFPFDRQRLVVDLLVREATTDEVVLRFDKDDIEFSRVAHGVQLDNWESGLVDLRGDVVAGWNGDRYSRIVVTLFVDRLATTSLAPIFIPLVASLLIPLLAIWMNRATEEGFEIPAFELANMGIGGLFSVIALSFAIYSAYGVVAGNDNTVTRLFGLNYISLAIALSIVVMFFRYNILLRWFGPYVQEQAFRFLTWALPLLSLATSIAFLLVAAA